VIVTAALINAVWAQHRALRAQQATVNQDQPAAP
jgi:hypothetical protein